MNTAVQNNHTFVAGSTEAISGWIAASKLWSFFALWMLCASSALGQQSSGGAPPAASAQVTAEKFKLPSPANRQSLQTFLESMRQVAPASADEYVQMQTAIRAASKQLLGMLNKKNDAELFQKIEFDAISSTVALMTTMSPEAREKSKEQIHKFLTDRKSLEIADVNTGLTAAMMLEMQPNKKPARETYELLAKLLKEDKRPEFQGLHFVAEGALRRLDLLGKELQLELKGLDGKPIDTSTLKERYAIVYFFKTDSASCQRMLPQLKTYSEKYTDKLGLIGISVDSEVETVQQFVRENSITWPIAIDNAANLSDRLSFKYGVSALPLSMLLNKIGEVVSLEAHSSELDRLMQMLFEAPTPAQPLPKQDENTQTAPPSQTP